TDEFTVTVTPVNDPPFPPEGLDDVEIDEDPDPRRIDLADLDEIFYDPDGDRLTYEVTSALRELNMDIDDRWNILFFAPDENFHISEGTDIIITADDSELTCDLHFSVVIDSVNDLPTDFELLTPAYGAYATSSPTVLFAWEESTDEADHSTITYALVLSFNDEEHWFRDIEETRIFVAREDLSVDVNDTTDIEWWVYAYDGIDSLRCETPFWLLVAPLSVNGVNETALPTELTLGPVYPNPFNASTTIKYGLPQATDVLLAVYDIYGRRAATLIDRSQQAGFYSAILGSENLVSGMYIIRIVTKDGILTRKVILVR
ncbi:T9SS type A sorting domain-containing protein, partial [bacterium]|nr:T9SS type A sorting domain-containing protein [bacterium]